MIRFFLQVAPGEMGDVPYGYLRAIAQIDIPVRAIPIGPAAAMNAERRWYDLSRLFMEPMRIRAAGELEHVNVVCAPLGTMLGVRAPMRAMGGTGDLVKQEGGVTDVMHFPRDLKASLGVVDAKTPDVVYEPATAFSGMWTKGYRNVAIITNDFLEPVAMPSASELRMLGDYDLIIVGAEGPSVQELRNHLDADWCTQELTKPPAFSGSIDEFDVELAKEGPYRQVAEIPPVLAVSHVLLEPEIVRGFGRLITDRPELELRADPAPRAQTAHPEATPLARSRTQRAISVMAGWFGFKSS